MRPAATWLIALALLAPALAGCLGAGDDTTDDLPGEVPDDWRFQDFIVPDHDHEDPAAHTYRSPTMEHVAWDQLGDESAHSYLGELDTRANLTAVAIVGQGSTPGFVLLDTSDPSAPERLGRAELPYGYAVDVKLTHDGRFALLATQSLVPGGTPTPESLASGTYAYQNGIAVWDLQDPSSPELISFTPVEKYGCHMLSIAEIDGTEWVFCINQSLTVMRLERSPQAQVIPVDVFWPFGQEGLGTVSEKQNPLGATPHDMTFQQDPVSGTPTLAVSHWDLGAVVLDVTNPLAPQKVFHWAGEGAQHYQGYVHSAMLTTLDDKRLLVVTPETLSDILPAIWVLDVTDWSSPELLAEWVNPGGHTSQGLIMTVHQVQLVDGRLYLAYNHNGLWVLDLATMVAHGGSAPDNAEVLGAIYPPVSELPVTFFERESFPMGRPAVWDLNVVDGYILGTDRYSGLHVVHYVEDETGPGGPTSFA